jgi:hypothetical protein
MVADYKRSTGASQSDEKEPPNLSVAQEGAPLFHRSAVRGGQDAEG